MLSDVLVTTFDKKAGSNTISKSNILSYLGYV